MNDKKPLTFWQIFNMSFGFFGIQFGWGLQMGNMSAIYKFLGADESKLAYLWLAAPITGFLVQPIIGYFSDRTWCWLGRRRPYFLVGAILASIALFIMPSSSELWMAAGLLWILDASVNVSMEPFRAFVGDKLPTQQRNTGFVMQSVFIGAGAVIASALPFILKEFFSVNSEATATNAIPATVSLAFHIGAVVFFVAVLYTILTSQENPPDDMEHFLKEKNESGGIGHAFQEIFNGVTQMPKEMIRLSVVQFFTWFALFCMWIYFSPAVGKKVFHGEPLGIQDAKVLETIKTEKDETLVNSAYRVALAYDELKKNLHAEPQAKTSFSQKMLQMFGLAKKPNEISASSDEIANIISNPTISALNAKQLAEPFDKKIENSLVQTIAQSLKDYKSDVGSAAHTIVERLDLAKKYEAGSAWAGICFSTYNLVAFVFAFILLFAASRFSSRTIHIFCLVLGSLGLLSASVATSSVTLLYGMIGVGIAWASILSMPYAILSKVVDPKRLGFFMGVFNLFIVIPQIIASLLLGKIVSAVFNNDAMKIIMLAGVSLAIAACACLFVSKDVEALEQK